MASREARISWGDAPREATASYSLKSGPVGILWGTIPMQTRLWRQTSTCRLSSDRADAISNWSRYTGAEAPFYR